MPTCPYRSGSGQNPNRGAEPTLPPQGALDPTDHGTAYLYAAEQQEYATAMQACEAAKTCPECKGSGKKYKPVPPSPSTPCLLRMSRKHASSSPPA